MQHYLDLHLRPDPELAPYQLLGALYARLHRSLVTLNTTRIGVSFPGHDNRVPTLGTHLRLHGDDSTLHHLMATTWLHGVRDHVTITSIGAVPSEAVHRQVTRVQAKSSPERLRRRAMRRHGISEDLAVQRIPDSAAEQLRLPFVVLGSRSTGQTAFPVFVRHGPVQQEPVPGDFSSYGLSRGATVPWF
ncbi:type I-F CRISPR-associated endoribonuclease Cas6/Csy4 [Xanthomonas albilineans]|uniref:Probable crispr-associated protein, csy4 family n=1 Tax=Xanthomonas albilineans (strain GPE PC73 / CFBP 7063) TaxID=380358 RepID=D2UGL9_XANAP|nr:type I-F CRISPR-associated endoribonuclease Cas6/Csy4 [Xanthomonas albilineans]QHQ29788.1 type I-F CRISPR-associated endoribonuclease Cas6/Csy4 [Xanthomonas albilineans]CBA17530.1 probable crispr-associated protein, csy4 family [Xanthomonas albilineans GPE PC73]